MEGQGLSGGTSFADGGLNMDFPIQKYSTQPMELGLTQS